MFFQSSKMKIYIGSCFILMLIFKSENVQSQSLQSELYTVDHEVAYSIDSTFNMYRRIYNENDNFVFSPLSFRIIYSILYQPAYRDCEVELKNLLFGNTSYLPTKDQILMAQTQNIDDILKSSKIRLVNKIYMRDDVQLLRSFQNTVGQYSTALEQVDFRNGSAVANRMNHWVEQQTNRLITNLIEPDSVDARSTMFLINTVYFKANWLSIFSKNSVRPKPFTSIDGTQKTIDAIHATDDYKISFNDELNVDVLELPYEHESGFAFWIILPKPNLNLSKLKNNLNVDFVTKINQTLRWNNVEIQFPIFEIESSIDGIEISPGIFGAQGFNIIDGERPSVVDAIKQKAKIIVNTKGTEAAAVTYVQVVSFSMPRRFIVDRPFMYAVVSDKTKEPIFFGHFSKA